MLKSNNTSIFAGLDLGYSAIPFSQYFHEHNMTFNAKVMNHYQTAFVRQKEYQTYVNAYSFCSALVSKYS